jgi:hypothetical protein
VGEERLDLARAHSRRISAVVGEKALHPVRVGVLGPAAVVERLDGLVEEVEHTGSARVRDWRQGLGGPRDGERPEGFERREKRRRRQGL